MLTWMFKRIGGNLVRLVGVFGTLVLFTQIAPPLARSLDVNPMKLLITFVVMFLAFYVVFTLYDLLKKIKRRLKKG